MAELVIKQIQNTMYDRMEFPSYEYQAFPRAVPVVDGVVQPTPYDKRNKAHPVVIVQIRKASAAADAATQSAENAVRMLGNEPMLVQAAVVAAEQGVAAFKTVTDIYAR